MFKLWDLLGENERKELLSLQRVLEEEEFYRNFSE